MNIAVNINVTKIDKAALVPGKNGKYMDLFLIENKTGQDQYGNDGFVTQGISKDRRDAGERGPIVGNWKRLVSKSRVEDIPSKQTASEHTDDDIPF